MARPSRRGFTLVELLVVIGIIALLISILIPTLNAAREQARRVQCMSNVRQLTMAWLMYANDNKGRFCNANTQAAPPHDPNYWIGGLNQLGFHLGGLPDPQPDVFWSWIGAGVASFDIHGGKLWPYVKSEAVYRCPGVTLLTYNSDYQINGLLAGEVGIPITLFRLSQIKHPQSTFVFTEAYDPNGWLVNSFKVPIYPARIYSTAEVPGQNHLGASAGEVLSFADGHAIYWQYSDIRTGQLHLENNTKSGELNVLINTMARSPDVYQLEAWSGGPVPPGVNP